MHFGEALEAVKAGKAIRRRRMLRLLQALVVLGWLVKLTLWQKIGRLSKRN